MKVIDNRTSRTRVKFEDLPIGDGYLDLDENICIKTSDEYDSHNCIFYKADYNAWEPGCESRNIQVQPIKITYTVEG